MPSSGGQTCARSEEHTSELQSHSHLVCRLLLEKKNTMEPHVTRTADPHAAMPTRDVPPSSPPSLSPPPPPARSSDPFSPDVFENFFFFKDTATTEIYPLSLHDALPIPQKRNGGGEQRPPTEERTSSDPLGRRAFRSEEHTSALQSQSHLVCRLLLE